VFANRPVTKTRLDFNPLIHQVISYGFNIYILTITLIHTTNLVGATASGRQQVVLWTPDISMSIAHTSRHLDKANRQTQDKDNTVFIT